MFNRLKQFRRIATCYDKTTNPFLGFLCLAAARLWLPFLSTGPNAFRLYYIQMEQCIIILNNYRSQHVWGVGDCR